MGQQHVGPIRVAHPSFSIEGNLCFNEFFTFLGLNALLIALMCFLY